MALRNKLGPSCAANWDWRMKTAWQREHLNTGMGLPSEGRAKRFDTAAMRYECMCAMRYEYIRSMRIWRWKEIALGSCHHLCAGERWKTRH